MKKMINLAFGYAAAALVSGVFYREFTKLNGYTDVTTLGKMHTHLFTLGMIVFLIVALFTIHTTLNELKQFKQFLIIYNIGISLTTIMMLIRGILQVLDTPLSTGANAAISGIAGIAHIFTGAGLVLLFLALRKIAKN